MANALVQTEKMTIEEFVRRYDTEGPFEILDGEIIKLMPTVSGHSEIIHILYNALLFFLAAKPLGRIYIETTFALPESMGSNWLRGARVPDLMFFGIDRLIAYKENTTDVKNKPFFLVPDLVVEVISENDSYTDVTHKVELYLQDGVLMIWVVDPKRQQVAIYSPDQPVLFLSNEDKLSGGSIIPGFEIEVAKLFA